MRRLAGDSPFGWTTEATSRTEMAMKWVNRLGLPAVERLSPGHTHKLSDGLLELAEEIAPRTAPEELCRAAVVQVVVAWNYPLHPEEGRGAVLDQIT